MVEILVGLIFYFVRELVVFVRYDSSVGVRGGYFSGLLFIGLFFRFFFMMFFRCRGFVVV